jgi:hypothetical protein
MADDAVLKRVEKLEKTLKSLATLPGEVADLKGRVGTLELQIVQLRTEMTDGFSAVHVELRRLQDGLASTRREVLEIFDSSSRATAELFRETWSQMRVLHEDVISRIKALGE